MKAFLDSLSSMHDVKCKASGQVIIQRVMIYDQSIETTGTRSYPKIPKLTVQKIGRNQDKLKQG